MSGEIVTNVSIYAKKGGLLFNIPTQTDQIDMAGSHEYTNYLDIPTTAAGTVLPVGASLATLGMSFFTNLDATNYVEVGIQVAGTFYPTERYKPGEAFVVRRVPGVTYYARAHTAACTLGYTILED